MAARDDDDDQDWDEVGCGGEAGPHNLLAVNQEISFSMDLWDGIPRAEWPNIIILLVGHLSAEETNSGPKLIRF